MRSSGMAKNIPVIQLGFSARRDVDSCCLPGEDQVRVHRRAVNRVAHQDPQNGDPKIERRLATSVLRLLELVCLKQDGRELIQRIQHTSPTMSRGTP